MERLWHFTAAYTPRGDIGKIPDVAIARACAWPESISEELIEGLVQSRWLDRSESFRLIIHDWAEFQESNEATQKRRARAQIAARARWHKDDDGEVL